VKNLHLPLPEATYEQLRSEALRSGIPATSMARRAIQTWLEARAKAQRNTEIMAYASKMAGTAVDLDAALERATIELLKESRS
jgi:hypothetical protein